MVDPFGRRQRPASRQYTAASRLMYSLLDRTHEQGVLCHKGAPMKAVVLYESGSASMESIMAVYPRHKQLVDAFAERGEVIAIGPFGGGGSMGVFRDRQSAEAFVAQDPFILEGLVGKITIRDWNETLMK
jgi:uncharacterized protein